MSKVLRNKAIQNLDAAQILKDLPNYHHCSSIHCSYYSCFQAIKYIIIEQLNQTDKEIYSNRQAIRKNENGNAKVPSEHAYLIEELHSNIISEKGDFVSALKFHTSITRLQSLRTEADYKEIPFEKDKSDQAYNLAEEVHKILRKVYKYDQN